MFVFSVLVVLLPASVLSNGCLGKADGNYEIGCRSYEICRGGIGIVHNCPDPPATNTVYNNVTKRCDDPRNVAGPCGDWKDCTNHLNHRYPDLNNHCHSYYTCQGETYFGHNICTPGLVFDYSLQTCNWPNNVSPPCGTNTR